MNRFTWKLVYQYALEHRGKIFGANVIALMATLIFVPLPLFMPMLVDEVILEKPGQTLFYLNQVIGEEWRKPYVYIITLLIITMVLRVSSLLLNVWQTWVFTIVSKDVVLKMRNAMLRHLQFISMSEYETLGGGTVSSYLNTDVNTIDQFVGQTVSKAIISILTLLGIAGVLLYLHWKLAIIILIFNPIVIFFTVAVGKKVKQLKTEENKAVEVFQQALVETLDAIGQIRASNRDGHYIAKLISHAQEVRKTSAAFSWKSDAAGRFSFVIFLLGIEVFKAIAMIMVIYSGLTIGEMFAVFGYLWFMMGPVQELLHLQYAYYGAKGALHRINSLFALQKEPVYEKKSNPFLDKNTVAVDMKEITFAYGNNEDVLKGVSLHINAGEKVAIVGASGGGKSTMVQVLLGMYPKKMGSVTFDGVPIEEIGLDVVRENVGTVLQSPALLNDTVRINLTMGIERSDEEIWHALRIAQLSDFISSLELQLDTLVGKQGVRLSGGQRQRLAIARMILMNPKIVVLDEATSALDQTTEGQLHLAMTEYLKEKTTLIIAHRLSAVKQADRVYVFEDGVILEKGTHDELMEQKGLYAKLYE